MRGNTHTKKKKGKRSIDAGEGRVMVGDAGFFGAFEHLDI